MLFSSYQVVDVLLLVGNVAPVALYFLALGLVNSHSRPYLITRRADFVALTIVLVPVVFWPLPKLLYSGSWWPLIPTGCLLAGLFFWMLPRAGDGFVVYNIAESKLLRALEGALRALRLPGSWEGKTWRSDCGRLVLHVRSFAILRNVTLHVEGSDTTDLSFTLAGELNERLACIAQLPSSTGAGLVLIGLGLMILPMWTVSRHIDDLVDAMLHLFG
jgi:hypothetical protein